MTERGWKYYPALKLVIAFSLGIVLCERLYPTPQQLLILLYAAIALLALAMRGRRGDASSSLLLSVLLSGAIAYRLQPSAPTEGLQGSVIRDAQIVGRAISDPTFKGNHIEFLVEIDSMGYRNSTMVSPGRAILRLYDSSAFDPGLLPRYGDLFVVNGTVTIPSAPKNPGEFDYSRYLRSQGIYFTVSVSRASIIYRFRRGDLDLWERLILWARRSAREFAERHVGGEEGDVVTALLLGERQNIDPETRDAFMRTGTIHVLAVSGLHVGIIALILFVILSWIPNRWVGLILFVAMLAFYVAITGATPSIVRAALMASAFMLARVAGRIARPLNTLGFAGLVILLYSPSALYDVGFQLSFASVAGIILLYAPLDRAAARRFQPIYRYALPRIVVQSFMLSLSAQIATLPLLLYHFSYLSLIAPLLNIVVVPLTSIALGAGLAGAILGSGAEYVGRVFGGAAWISTWLAERLVLWGADLEMAGVQVGSIGPAGALILGGAIVYLGFSCRAGQALLRSLSCSGILVMVILMSRCLDPLAVDNAVYLVLLTSRNGMVAATVVDKRLTLYTWGRSGSDSSVARYSGTALQGRMATRSLQCINLDSVSELRPCDDLLQINGDPDEFALRSLPVLLSITRQRRLAMVSTGRDTLLQVPLRVELDEAIILRYDGGRWEVIDWH